jgi:hypothetical protein
MKNEKDFPWYVEFEKQGEDYVRQTFSEREDEVGRSARPWLEMKRVEREVEASSKRDAREEETLSIAKEANRLASEANSFARLQAAAASRSARYAMYAAAIAATVAIAGYKDQILKLIEILKK